MIGEEPRLAYNRVLLSAVLAGEVASSEIELNAAWWRDAGVTLLYGSPRHRSIRRRRAARQRRDASLSKLVLATGSRRSG